MAGHHRFAPGSCERLEPFLTEHVVGQELALRQFCDAVCDLGRGQSAGPGKPLIMSGQHWVQRLAIPIWNRTSMRSC